MTMQHDLNELMTRRRVLGGLLGGAALAAVSGVPALADPPRVASASGRTASSHELKPGLDLARESLNSLANVKDYTATLFKQEMVGRKKIVHQLELKLREEPFSVYLRFINPHEGREAVYFDGRNDGKMLAHGTGIEAIAGTLKLEPTGDRALEESRYPVTMIGRRRMLETLIKQWESELALTGATVRYYPNAKIENIECRVFESSYAAPAKGIQFQMTRLYVSREDGAPLRVEQFDFPDRAGAAAPMVEQYTYLNVRNNVGLTDIDFDTANPAYGF